MAETKDGLVDVSYGEEIIFAAKQVDEVPLEWIGVLQFVHEDVVEGLLDAGAEFGLALEEMDGILFEAGEIDERLIAETLAVGGVEAVDGFEHEIAFGLVELEEPEAAELGGEIDDFLLRVAGRDYF